jgi:hypothetical protein
MRLYERMDNELAAKDDEIARLKQRAERAERAANSMKNWAEFGAAYKQAALADFAALAGEGTK